MSYYVKRLNTIESRSWSLIIEKYEYFWKIKILKIIYNISFILLEYYIWFFSDIYKISYLIFFENKAPDYVALTASLAIYGTALICLYTLPHTLCQIAYRRCITWPRNISLAICTVLLEITMSRSFESNGTNQADCVKHDRMAMAALSGTRFLVKHYRAFHNSEKEIRSARLFAF